MIFAGTGAFREGINERATGDCQLVEQRMRLSQTTVALKMLGKFALAFLHETRGNAKQKP